MFCKECGKKCIEEWTGYYNEIDGSKHNRFVCPDACKHGHHFYESHLINKKHWFFGGNTLVDTCKRCGHEEIYYPWC